MPKKQQKESAKEQAERFAAEVERLIEAGELNPIDADAALDSLVSSEMKAPKTTPPPNQAAED